MKNSRKIIFGVIAGLAVIFIGYTLFAGADFGLRAGPSPSPSYPKYADRPKEPVDFLPGYESGDPKSPSNTAPIGVKKLNRNYTKIRENHNEGIPGVIDPLTLLSKQEFTEYDLGLGYGRGEYRAGIIGEDGGIMFGYLTLFVNDAADIPKIRESILKGITPEELKTIPEDYLKIELPPNNAKIEDLIRADKFLSTIGDKIGCSGYGLDPKQGKIKLETDTPKETLVGVDLNDPSFAFIDWRTYSDYSCPVAW